MSKWARKMLWGVAAFGGIVTVSVIYAWFFGTQTFFALQTRHMARRTPIVESVPIELEDLTVSTAKGKKLSFQGAEFEVPWDDIDGQKTRIAGKWAVIHFQSGRSIILCVGTSDMFLKGLSKDKTPDPEIFARIYGPQVLKSDYALYDALYKTTPSQITLTTPSNRAAGLGVILIVKAIMPPTTDWAIFRVQSNGAKGFQLGNPARRPKKRCLELFTEDAEYEINISQDGAGATPPITQAELNRIIQTVHKTADAQSTLTVNPA
jgi:hypothetical protein